MPAPKGHPKWGGRTKGTGNKITREVAQRLAELDHDPVEALVIIAKDLSAPLAVRARCNMDLLEYVKPKLSRHEVVGPLGADGTAGPVELRVTYVDKPIAE